MKVIKENKIFSPINIVLETQEEVDWLYAITRYVGGSGAVRNFFDNIRCGLMEEASEQNDVFEGGPSLYVYQ